MTKLSRLPLAIALVVALSGCGVLKKGQRSTPTLGNRVPILVSENGAEKDKSIAEVQILLPPATINDSWAQPGGDSAKALGHVALGASIKELWSARIDGGSNRERLAAAPVVADGKLFVMDVHAVVHAFNADTGAKLWSAPTIEGKENRAARFGGGVSYDDGKLFASTGLGNVVAMDASDGKVLWSVKHGGPLRGAPSVAYGAVYILSQDNVLYAISVADGKVQWFQSGSIESQGVFGVAAPAASRGTIVAGFSSGELNAYRYENGQTLWQETLSRTSISTSVSSLADIDAEPVIDQNRVYAVGQGGRTVALELTTGRRLWEQNIAGISTPWISGEWLYVLAEDAKLYCLARSNGKVRWISDLGAFRNVKKRKGPIIWTGPILAGGRLIAVNSRGQIATVSPTTGEKLETIKGSGPFSLSPVVANNTLYLIDSSGRITAYR